MVSFDSVLRNIAAVFASLFLSTVSAAAFESGRLDFSLEINGDSSDYHAFFSVALPGESVSVRILQGAGKGVYQAQLDERLLSAQAPGRWSFAAPSRPGYSKLKVWRAGGKPMHITLFTLVPASKVRNGVLNNYRIGTYPKTPYKGLAEYMPPKGFIEVSEEARSLKLSPHFTLGQFLCKQESAYPKYLVLRPRLLLKLEGLLADVNARGVRADSFTVMSGYRTPYYNALIKNVENSRHLWGGAADIFIDADPVDNLMDDINGDGRTTKADALQLYQWADRYVKKYARPDLVGGVGAYGSTASHGPFVHIDVRGQRARWGAN